jgi:hypothetical protein
MGAIPMKSLSWKCLLAVVVLLCMAPASFANKPYKDKDKCRPGVNCRQVPEGGSAAIYLLGAGITCLGAMLIRSRETKPKQA